VRGWLRVQSFTDPPQRLFDWKLWRIESQSGAAREVTVLEARAQGNGWVARLEGIDERDAASRLSGMLILVDRDSLPPTGEREYYRADLIGFEATNLEGAVLGAVDYFIDTAGGAAMVIKGTREHCVPTDPRYLRRVDLDAKRLIVDWPEDF
jgi:16S rRNA processing protein RimM